MPFAQAVRLVGREVGVSVVVSDSLSDAMVAPEFMDVEAETALRSLARSVGVNVVYENNVVSFRSRAESMSSAVFDVGYAAENFAEVVSSVADGAKVGRLGDRVLVSGSSEEVDRIRASLSSLDSGPDGWLLTVLVFQVSDSLARDVGLKWSPSVGVKIGLGVNSGTGVPSVFTGASAQVVVDMLASASDRGDQARLMTQGALYVLEGRSSTLQQGDVVPIPRRVVSDQGTVSTVGYDEKKTGFTFSASGQRVPGGVLLTLKPSLSLITSYVGDAPVTSERSVDAVVALTSGQWVVLSGLESAEWIRGADGVPGLGDSLLASRLNSLVRGSAVYVVVRAERVFSSGSISQGETVQGLSEVPAMP